MIRAVIAVFLLSITPALAEVNFIVPDGCTQGVTGAGEENASDEWAPIVQITYQKSPLRKRYVTPDSVYRNLDGTWSARFFAPADKTYFFVTTYTPFLQSYNAFDFNSGQAIVHLPFAAYQGSYHPLYTLFDSLSLTIADSSEEPIAGAFVEIAPDFQGSGPYTVQAAQDGSISINCFDYAAGRNFITVYGPDHDFLYSGTIEITGKKNSREHTIRGTGLIVPLPGESHE
ncbi:hypothetical protein LPB41_14280 [Thalassospira sp. MA62]|nr:hypothetical protein [Thalassospira sp. MA62]